jgi:hypothetical protein
MTTQRKNLTQRKPRPMIRKKRKRRRKRKRKRRRKRKRKRRRRFPNTQEFLLRSPDRHLLECLRRSWMNYMQRRCPCNRLNVS